MVFPTKEEEVQASQSPVTVRKTVHLDRIKLNRIGQIKATMEKYGITLEDLMDTIENIEDDKKLLAKHRTIQTNKRKFKEQTKKSLEAAHAKLRQQKLERDAVRNVKKTEEAEGSKNKLLAAFGLEDNGIVNVPKE